MLPSYPELRRQVHKSQLKAQNNKSQGAVLKTSLLYPVEIWRIQVKPRIVLRPKNGRVFLGRFGVEKGLQAVR